ncbi:UNVERIFIED_CONTAM: Pentatricopeptide repeat-containing protein [Sesamum latifolium]|uniref:Pentatricopeptide repeat-containing protein n=1 Tax=Sesamum latifolium TaxID=2727402 RepID=A0AAW2SUH1_9LAMI
MVDLFGRSGCLHEAESLVLSMPFAPDGGIWGSLLTACKMHNNAEMGIKIAKRAIETDQKMMASIICKKQQMTMTYDRSCIEMMFSKMIPSAFHLQG